MNFDAIARAAARQAEEGTKDAMQIYNSGSVEDEDDLTGVLVGTLSSKLSGKIGGVKWSASILRHRRGKAAQEKRIGADLLIHVCVDILGVNYSKGVLVQAKRVEPMQAMEKSEHDDLRNQCRKMLHHTSHAYVFDYVRGGMRCGSAIRIAGSENRRLYKECTLTPYRFFYELFRCPIGDPQITSARVDDLPTPHILFIKGIGDSKPDL